MKMTSGIIPQSILTEMLVNGILISVIAFKIAIKRGNRCDCYLKDYFLIWFKPFVFFVINFDKIVKKAYDHKTCSYRKR